MRIITTIVCAVFALLGVGEARAEVALDAASQEVLPEVENFTFSDVITRETLGEFPNEIAKAAHTDRWLVKPSRYRTTTWEWMNAAVGARRAN